MSIKSEKAKHYIATKEEQRIKMRLGYIPMHDHSLEHLTEITESDAEVRDRERAARAFKMSCNARYRVNCGRGDLQGTLMCPEGQDCRSDCVLLTDFLKHYDNE